jgi:endogenous inhibitor of DNA gyrase (YacG/DUF329 family)
MSNLFAIKVCMILIFGIVFVGYSLILALSGDDYSSCDKDIIHLFMFLLLTLSVKTSKIDALITVLLITLFESVVFYSAYMINQTHYCEEISKSELVKFSFILIVTTIWIDGIFLAIVCVIIVIELISLKVRECIQRRLGTAVVGIQYGLSDNDKRKLFSSRFKTSDEVNEECPICLAMIVIEEEAIRMPGCSHVFHKGCLHKWINQHSTCPYCRTPIEFNEVEEELE